MNSDTKSAAAISRRRLLTGLGAGSAGVAVTAAALAASGGTVAAAEAAARPAKAGYRETDHVRRVYELARF